MAEQKKHVPISKLVLEAKRCPISGLWPHLYPTPDGTYYFTCSPMCTWNISDSTDCALCNYKKNTYSSICTKKHVRESDAVAEWNIIMDAMQSTSASQPEPQPITMPVSTDIALEIKADTFLNPVGDLCSGMKIRLIDAHNKEERIAAAVFYDSTTRCVRISCL